MTFSQVSINTAFWPNDNWSNICIFSLKIVPNLGQVVVKAVAENTHYGEWSLVKDIFGYVDSLRKRLEL